MKDEFSKPPKQIYLQWYDHEGEENHVDDKTWSDTQIGSGCIKYKRVRPIKVFMGGTVEGWDWRSEIVKFYDKGIIDWFNPVVENWNEEARKREVEAMRSSDFNLFLITPDIKGVFSIFEVTQNAFLNPKKTIFAFTCIDDHVNDFTNKMKHSLVEISKRLENMGIMSFHGRDCDQVFQDIVDYIRSQV